MSTFGRNRFKVKDVKFSYHVEDVFNIDIPQLQHGNDGLIYTCVSTPYAPGTDPNMCVTALIWLLFFLSALLFPVSSFQTSGFG